MDAEFETKLIECLTALEQRESIDEVLARYPNDAAQLRPILETTALLPTFRMEPSEAMKMKSRQSFLNQAAAARIAPQRRRIGLMPRLLTSFVAVALICIVLGGGAVAASGSALPGDPLYGVKRTVENVRLSLTTDNAARAALTGQFEGIRRDEANALLDAGRETEVEFSGAIQSIQPKAWVVSGLVVQLDNTTKINGEPKIDRRAQVDGRTGPNGLWAKEITIETSASTPQLTETPEPTETPAPTETPESAKTPTPRSTLVAEPTETPEPKPTVEPTEQPTVAPVAIEFAGTVDDISAQAWTIDSTSIGVNANTEIRGSITVGQRVKVQAHRLADGRLVALRIELVSDGTGSSTGSSTGNSNQNGNENSNQNENQNHNQNQNENHNENQNQNHNENQNQNQNENHNDNQNQNENQNHNENQNSNDN
jgi:cell division septation protein DedD